VPKLLPLNSEGLPLVAPVTYASLLVVQSVALAATKSYEPCQGVFGLAFPRKISFPGSGAIQSRLAALRGTKNKISMQIECAAAAA
jgi:hypothetical protein